jgi:hypothetical protein
MWKLTSVRLEIMLISKQDRCTVCAKRSIGSENQFGCRFVLLCDVVQVEARFGPFGDSVILNARLVHGLHGTCNRLGNCFGCTRWNY